MKHAFLIIAHHEERILRVLLDMLDDARNDIYLHIDCRAKDMYAALKSHRPTNAGFYLLEQRMNVYWGDISQVEVEYRLFEEAFSHGPYAYYHLLSGVDLPIKNQDTLHHFFDQNHGCEFVGFWNDAAHRRDLERKVSRYYLFTRWIKDHRHPWHELASFSRNIALAVQKATRFHRRKTYDFRKGGNWVSITHDFCAYVLSHREEIFRRFKYTLCPDEIFLQTLLWNSAFRNRIYDAEDARRGSMREIDWQRGSPYTWRKEDLKELLSSECMFARKFSSTDMDIVLALQAACASIN